MQSVGSIWSEDFSDLQFLRDAYGAGVVGNPTPVESPYGRALSFDGSDDKIVIGLVHGTVKSLMMRVWLASTTEQILDFDSGTNFLSASAGTLSVATCADEVLYVNGAATATITAGGWRNIAFTTATGIAVSNLQVATDNTDFGEIICKDLIMFGRELSSTEISDFHYGRSF